MLSDRDFFARVLREANSWTELGLHPNIAYCYYVRNIEDVPHIFVEYVDGGNLRQWIEEGKCIDYRTSLDLAIQFCHGMEHAHSKGMIHRDIKPENILMTKDGVLKITDFGLVRAKQKPLAQENFDEPQIKADSSGLTALGALMGTPGYISPEQVKDPAKVDERADIFSFGVCLYEMFCGNKPYEITSGKTLVVSDPVDLSGDANFPDPLATILKKCVQHNYLDRFSSFNQIRHELSRVYETIYAEPNQYSELELFDLEADGLNNRGVSYIELGKFQDANAYFKKAIDVSAHHLAAVYNKELLGWRQGVKTDLGAMTGVKSLRDLVDDKSRYQFLLAQLLLERGDAKNAVLALLKAVEIQPAVSELWEKLGEAYLYLSDQKEAVTAYKRAAALSSGVGKAAEMLNVLAKFPDPPSEFNGCCWQEMDLAGTFASGKKHLAFHGDTRQVLVRTSDKGGLAVAGLFDRSPLLEIPAEEAGRVRCASFSTDGKSVVLIGSESAAVWTLETGAWLKSVPFSRSWGLDIKGQPLLCEDGTILLVRMGSAGEKSSVFSCSAGQSEFQRLCIEPGSHILSIDIDDANRRLLTVSRDGACRMWSLNSGFGDCFHYNPKGMVSASFGQSHAKHITCSRDGNVTVWHGQNSKFKEIVTHPDYAVSASLNRNNTLLATLNAKRNKDRSDLGHIHLWEMSSGRCLSSITEVDCGYESKLEFSQDQTQLLAFSEKDGLRVWHLPHRFPDAGYEFCRPHSAFEVTTAGKKAERNILEAQALLRQKNDRRAYRLLRSAQDDPNYVFDHRIIQMLRLLQKKGRKIGIQNSRCLHTMVTEPKAPITALAFVDEASILSGASYGGLYLWDFQRAKCQGELRGHSDAISKIVVAPHGGPLVTVDKNKRMRVWDIRQRKCMAYFDYFSYEDLFHHLSVSPDGKKAFSTNGKNKGLIWDLEIEEMDDQFDLPVQNNLIHAQFSFDGNSIFIKTDDNSWFKMNLFSKQWEPAIKDYPMSKSGHLGATIVKDTLLLHEMISGKEWGILRGHQEPIRTFAISPDELYLVSGDEAGKIKVWEFDWQLKFD
jgi:WD40 repeat protein